MSERREYIQCTQENPERLDICVTGKLDGISRARIQGIIKDGCVSVNGCIIQKASHLIGPGDEIVVLIPDPKPNSLVAENIPLDIVFENKDLLVINKPAGMVVHPSPGHTSGTLVHATLGHVSDLAGIGGEERPGIVHRLDKDTSGLIVIAKNDLTHQLLQEQFKSRKVEKLYLGLVDGKPPTPTGRVDAPIGRNTTHRKLMAVVPLDKGREAITEYRTLETFQEQTLLEIHPLTGRTHQIRVHMAFLGCPITGDSVYGKRRSTLFIPRHFLHAYRLKITIPGEKSARTFQAELPKDLEQFLEDLRAL